MAKNDMQANDFIDVFTDGSCNYQDRKLGIGIVVPISRSEKPVIFWKTIIPDDTLDLNIYGALSAEFKAATHALMELPENCRVRLHTDHPILRTILRRYISKEGNIENSDELLWKPRNKRGHTEEFKTLLSDLFDGLKKHKSIEVVRANEISHEEMQWAHQAAAKGSGARGKSKVWGLNRTNNKNDPWP